jgi:hypothetical protein
MFVGHYGPSFVAKALDKTIPLWILFLAVQLVDVFWAIFVILGVEKARIASGITATNPLDLYYMPYTHSLVATILWALAAGVGYRAHFRRNGWSAAVAIGVVIFSHWILDLLVHRPDLPLYDDALKVGLGLWNRPVAAFALEAASLFGGMALYLRATAPVGRGGRYEMAVFGAVMLTIHGLAFFSLPPTSAKAAAAAALAAYIAFAGVAFWLERKRA